jgi:uncharacterized protein (TIGR03086 family)
MKAAQLYQRARDRFGEYTHQVREDQWGGPTPCADWDVRALVHHLVYENKWAPPLLAGATVAQIGDRFEGDLLGTGPAVAYDAAAREAAAAVAAGGELRHTVHLSFGDFPAEEYVWQLFADHLIHGWDLAHAIGADERMDPELVEACAAWFAPMEGAYRSAGAIGSRADLPAAAGPQATLLAAFGRAAG